MERLQEIIDTVEDLPSLPVVFTKIEDLLKDPDTTCLHVAEVISEDQSLSARLLKLVNSSFYGFQGEISTISRAVNILGFKALRDLVLATSVAEIFKNVNGSGFDMQRFWEHSLGCAVGARVIAKYLGVKEEEEFFVCGLLHDIGRIVLENYFHDEFAQAFVLADKKKMHLVQAEEDVLGFSHADAGYLLTKKWQIPESVQDVIRMHHIPERSENFKKEIAVVHLADILSHAKEFGSSGNSWVPSLEMKAWENLECKESVLEPIMEEMEVMFKDALDGLMPG